MKELSDDTRSVKAASRAFAAVLIATMCAAILAPASLNAQILGRHPLSSQIPAAAARLKPIADMSPSQPMDLTIDLPLRDPEGLRVLLQQLYDPSSPMYHHFLTTAEFTARFGPTEQDYQAVIAFAQSHGLTVSSTHPNRMVVSVKGTAAAVQKALNIQFRIYRHPTESRNFFAPDSEPTLDLSVPVLTIDGLNDYSRPVPLHYVRPTPSPSAQAAPAASPEIAPASGQGPTGTYLGSDFRDAYVPGVTLTGQGQVVALFELDGYYASDIAAYEALAGLPSVPLVNFPFNFSGPSTVGGIGEVSLDIEMVIAMAPGLSAVHIYETDNNGNNSFVTTLLQAIANDNQAKTISSSWLLPDNPTWEQIYQQMAAQGQSFMQASGDDGAFNWSLANQQHTDSTNITLVGGTTLTTTGPSGSYVSEKAWNWYSTGQGKGATGGGISPNFPIPSWQQGVYNPANGSSPISRNIPDVALTADNIWVISNQGIGESVGGTSAAAPLWAAYLALANQQAATLGKPPVGFINPLVYSLGLNAASLAADFHDVTTGSNGTPASVPFSYPAVAGYDLCTGWGSPNGQNLINALVGAVPRTGVMQASFNPLGGSALIASTSQTIIVTVNDISGITNATVVGVIPGVANLTFTNPLHDNNYRAVLAVPATLGNIAMTVIVTNVAGEVGTTNIVPYTVIATPPNDNFANASKISSSGAVILSNNRFATTEPQEPHHGGASGSGNSLWWNFVSTTTTSVYVDTTGSSISTAVSVYTGTSAASTNLTQIVGTNNLSSRQHVFMNFTATAGVTYHIAVASATAGVVGSVTLAVLPGGQPDTVPPTLQVLSPLSGLWVSNKFITVTGSAYDPSPNASGVRNVSLTVNNLWQFTASGTNNWTSLIALMPGLNNIQITAVDVQSNVSATANLQLTFVSPNPVNDLFNNASPITLTNNGSVVTAITTNATKEFGEPQILGNPGGHSVWWSFTPTADGVVELNTSGSTFDTLLGVYTGASVANLTTVAQNDDAFPGAPGGFSLLDQAVRAGQTYFITVDGYNSSSGAVLLTCLFTPATIYTLTTTTNLGGTLQVTTTNNLHGVSTLVGSSGDFAANTYLTLTATPATYYQFTNWTGTTTSPNNPLTFFITQDTTETPNFMTFPFTEGFESGNFSHLSWYFGGDAPWFVQTNVVAFGQYAARSGGIGNSQSSSLLLTTNFTDGTASFDVRISSEATFDVLTFSVDGTTLQQWSGESDWSTFSFPMTNGVHTLQWTYTKDASLTAGLDAAFIDDLILPITAPAGGPAPGHLSLQRLPNGTFQVNLAGQPNQQYVIQASTNLVDWVNLSTNIAVGGLIAAPDSGSVSNQVRFYRAVTLP